MKMRRFWTALAVAAFSVTASGQERDRAKIPDKFKWDLGDIYRNEAAWRAAKDKLSADIQSLGSFKGKLTASPAALADALDRIYAVAQELGRAYSYASLRADEDTRISANQGMRQEMVQVAAAFSAAAAYVDPEILKAGKATIDKFVAAEPRLKPYRMKLDDVVRRAAHTLSDSEEKLLADLQPVSGSAQNVFSILSNADFPYPTVTLSDGRSVRLDAAGYNAARAVANRADREKAMSAFFTSLGSFSRTYGTTMNAEAQKVLFHAKTRRYASALESELDTPNIPVSVYNRLVEGVNRNLPSFHRYLKLRKRMMGVDQLHYYDLYAPLVASVNLSYTPEEAQRLVLDAVEPLGKEYAATIQKAFADRWIDLFPNVGKRSGRTRTASSASTRTCCSTTTASTTT